MGVIHPKAYQGQMQKVGIWPNYTEGALLLTQMQEEIFLGDSPDGSVLNLQSSNVLMNQSPKTWPCLIYSDNPLRRQRYLAFLFARHFKHPTLNWPLNPEGSCFSAEKISHFEIWIMRLKSPGFRQVHDWGRWGADERRIEGSLQNLRQRGGNEKQHRGKIIEYDCLLPSVTFFHETFCHRARGSSRTTCWRTSCARSTTRWQRTTSTTSSRRLTRTVAAPWTSMSSKKWWWDRICTKLEFWCITMITVDSVRETCKMGFPQKVRFSNWHYTWNKLLFTCCSTFIHDSLTGIEYKCNV